jgi:hypothetical protein
MFAELNRTDNSIITKAFVILQLQSRLPVTILAFIHAAFKRVLPLPRFSAVVSPVVRVSVVQGKTVAVREGTPVTIVTMRRSV